MMRINQGVSNVALAPADLAPAWPAENRPLVWHGMAWHLPPHASYHPPRGGSTVVVHIITIF